MLEFALSLPILILLFLFAWQVIHVFIYDALGAYAAFASARSYSVFREHLDDPNEARVLARDVAVTIMASGSSYYEGFDDVDGRGFSKTRFEVSSISPGVRKFLELAERFNLYRSPSNEDPGAWEAAYSRMCHADTPFCITEYGSSGAECFSFGQVGPGVAPPIVEKLAISGVVGDCLADLKLKPGYIYKEKDEGGAGEPKSWWDIIVESVKGVLGMAPEVDPDTLTNVRVARISFTYHYPVWLSFLNAGYLSSQRSSYFKEAMDFGVYNTCAAPIEPILECSNPEEEKAVAPKSTYVWTQEIKEASTNVNHALKKLFENIEEESGKTLGDRTHMGAATYHYSSRNEKGEEVHYQPVTTAKKRFQPTRLVKKVFPEENGLLKTEEIPKDGTTTVSFSYDGTLLGEGIQKEVYSITDGFNADSKYRDEVIAAAKEEVKQLDTERKWLQRLKNNLAIMNGYGCSEPACRTWTTTHTTISGSTYTRHHSDCSKRDAYRTAKANSRNYKSKTYYYIGGEVSSMSCGSYRGAYDRAVKLIAERTGEWNKIIADEQAMRDENDAELSKYKALENKVYVALKKYYALQSVINEDQQRGLEKLSSMMLQE